MTRIVGYETHEIMSFPDVMPNKVNALFASLDNNIETVINRGWQVHSLGFLTVDDRNARVYKQYYGYRGITFPPDESSFHKPIVPRKYISKDLKDYLVVNHPDKFFAILGCRPDLGENEFKDIESEYKLNVEQVNPFETQNYYYLTMGMWGRHDYEDTQYPWYDSSRPSLSIGNYLESKPRKFSFNWIDPRRLAVVFAVSKDGKRFYYKNHWHSEFGTDTDGDYFDIQHGNGMTWYMGNVNSQLQLI